MLYDGEDRLRRPERWRHSHGTDVVLNGNGSESDSTEAGRVLVSSMKSEEWNEKHASSFK